MHNFSVVVKTNINNFTPKGGAPIHRRNIHPKESTLYTRNLEDLRKFLLALAKLLFQF